MHLGQAAPMMGKHLSRAQFVTWLQNKHPELWNAILTKSELGQAETTAQKKSFWDKIMDTVTTIGPAYLQYEAQRKMLKLNIERAQQGLPPLDPDVYGAVPTIRTEVDISPEIAGRLKEGIMGIGMNTLLLVGAGLAVFMLMRR